MYVNSKLNNYQQMVVTSAVKQVAAMQAPAGLDRQSPRPEPMIAPAKPQTEGTASRRQQDDETGQSEWLRVTQDYRRAAKRQR